MTSRSPRRSRTRPPKPALRDSIGARLRAIAMDCEADDPDAVIICWRGRRGVVKYALPGDPLLEEGLLCHMDRLGLGSSESDEPAQH